MAARSRSRMMLFVLALAGATESLNSLHSPASFKPASPVAPRPRGWGRRSSASALKTRATAVSEVEAGVAVLLEDGDIRRPSVDRRSYRLVRLANGLEALLASDPDCDEAGAALSVKAGSFDDTRLGLAHFHEHMLFLGTAKYPDEDEYEGFLAAHGGGSNAWTADEETCYYLNVNADALEGALDRLAQFFVSPLMSLDCVEREVKAVDSEYSMALNDDGWRTLSVLKATANPEHPFSRFSTGTEDTLLREWGAPESLLEELQSWNAKHYVGDRMRLSVVGKESLDELQAMISGDGRFGAVPRGQQEGKTVSKKGAAVAPWAASETPRVVRIVPVREWRSLQLLWPLPPRDVLRGASATSTPELLVSHLLGHEGAQTLHGILRDRGWIDGLSCGTAFKSRDGQLLELSVDLTEVGEANFDEVCRLAWAWVGAVKGASTAQLKKASDELEAMHAARFDFSEKRGAADTASDLADALWDHPTQPIAGPSLAGAYDDATARRVLAALDPSTCVVLDVRKHATDDGWAKERWHGATYDSRPTDGDRLREWRDAMDDKGGSLFRLPEANPYLPDDLQLVADPLARTGVYRVPGSEDGATVWRRADLSDAPESVPEVPKVMVVALFREARDHDALSIAAVKTLGSTVAQLLNVEAYDAQLAGLSQGREWVIQRRFNVGVLEAIPKRKASTL